MNQVIELEKAILGRARQLVRQFADQGQRTRESILREAAERVRQREQREEAHARGLGDRHYLQEVQAAELHLQSQLDRVRWNLVRAVEARLKTRMLELVADRPAYLAHLVTLVREAATQFETPTIRIACNREDMDLLRTHWDSIRDAAPDKNLEIDPDPTPVLAGIILLSPDGRIRVDHGFEGRSERLRTRVQQVILEQLFPASLESTPPMTG